MATTVMHLGKERVEKAKNKAIELSNHTGGVQIKASQLVQFTLDKHFDDACKQYLSELISSKALASARRG